MVRVKICGVTTKGDALIAVSLGTDYIGNIVEIPGSPRSISQKRSREILSSLPPTVRGVVVLAGKSVDEAVSAADFIRPAFVQLHGGESLEFVENVKQEVSCGVIKVVQVKGEESISAALGFAGVCDALLLDTPSERLGGSGRPHDWSISAQIVQQAKCHVFLAGGLNPENVAQAVAAVEPFCVDVSSGVEIRPGQKDPEKVKKFIEKAKCSS
ncbi:N-(5'-phosphoribosyl)anthranilate isomerase [archaeon BMS3Bbin16]|nr:N-(5'-phosphoribosyl)anthranilate isomerase [archaeon BMS3Bbin16]